MIPAEEPGERPSPERSTSGHARQRDDLILAQAAGAGDPEARRRLASRLLGRVETFVRYLVWSPSERDDLVQDAMIEILLSAVRFEGRASLERWAEAIAYRTVMARFREQYRETRLREAQAAVASPRETSRSAEAPDSPERLLEEHALRERISRLLHTLSAPKRTALVCKLVLGYSVREIAELTDAPENTVRDRLQAARREMKALVLDDPELEGWMEWRSP